jgi:hypothetical protein
MEPGDIPPAGRPAPWWTPSGFQEWRRRRERRIIERDVLRQVLASDPDRRRRGQVQGWGGRYVRSSGRNSGDGFVFAGTSDAGATGGGGCDGGGCGCG